MKYEAVSLNTKKMLSAALKEAMETKPLSKITVNELVSTCGVNRKTFYYHFKDIYDLLRWTLEQEAVEVVKSFDLLVDAQDAIRFAIDYVEQNRHILSCAYDSMGRDGLRSFLYQDFIDVALSTICQAEEAMGLRVDEGYQRCLADFYTEATAGMLISFFIGRSPYSRQELEENIFLLLRSTIPAALRAGPEHAG